MSTICETNLKPLLRHYFLSAPSCVDLAQHVQSQNMAFASRLSYGRSRVCLLTCGKASCQGPVTNCQCCSHAKLGCPGTVKCCRLNVWPVCLRGCLGCRAAMGRCCGSCMMRQCTTSLRSLILEILLALPGPVHPRHLVGLPSASAFRRVVTKSAHVICQPWEVTDADQHATA